MKHINGYNYQKNINKYNEFRVNEEFIGKLIGSLKGGLLKLFQSFAEPFKDLGNDVKNSFNDPKFKEDPTNGIKNMLLTNINQSIDGIKKSLPNIKDEGELNSIMDNLIKELTELGNGLDSDFDKVLANNSLAPKTLAKAIILGDKDTKWPGLVGAFTDPNFKFNKTNFETTLATAAKGKAGAESVALKIKAASTFFDNFKKEFSNYMNKEFNVEEMKKVYDNAKSAGGNPNIEYKEGDTVKYKMDGYDEGKKPEEQRNKVGVKKIEKIEGNDVIFKDKDGKEFKKPLESIIGKENIGDNAKEVAEVLGKIKTDEDKMGKVAKYAEFIEDPNNKAKVDEIEKMISGEAA